MYVFEFSCVQRNFYLTRSFPWQKHYLVNTFFDLAGKTAKIRGLACAAGKQQNVPGLKRVQGGDTCLRCGGKRVIVVAAVVFYGDELQPVFQPIERGDAFFDLSAGDADDARDCLGGGDISFVMATHARGRQSQTAEVTH